MKAQPGALRSLGRALRRRCPVCGDRAISRHVAQVEARCQRCGLDLERQVGSFIGGVGINTILALAVLVAVIAGGFVWTGGDADVVRVLLPALVASIVVPVIFYARSRLLWVAVELCFWPLEPGEVSLDPGTDSP